MRTATPEQASPTASPSVYVAIGNIFGTEGVDLWVFTSEGTTDESRQRIIKLDSDEQVWGSVVELYLDNSDFALDDWDVTGRPVFIRLCFLDSNGDMTPSETAYIFYVFNQAYASQEGTMQVKLTLADLWAEVSLYKSTLGNCYFNQPWQTEAELEMLYMPDGQTLVSEVSAIYNDLLENGDLNIKQIIIKVLGLVDVEVINPDYTDDPNVLLKPAFTMSDMRTGVRQLLEMTDTVLIPVSNIVNRRFKFVYLSSVPICFTYNDADLIYSTEDEKVPTFPNRIYLWSFNEDGDEWIAGESSDPESYAAYGRYVTRHYMLSDMDNQSQMNIVDLTYLAQGIMCKLTTSSQSAMFTATMHVAQELYDKVTVYDYNYTPTKTITGFVYRIWRTYDRGIYQMRIQLGGVTTGWTAPEGVPSKGLAEYTPLKFNGARLGGGGYVLTPTTNLTNGDWYSGTATSGATGDDLVTIGTEDVAMKVIQLMFATANLTNGANINVRLYHEVNGVEKLTYDQTFQVGVDTPALWIINGSLGIYGELRCEVTSDKSTDDNKNINWVHIIEEAA